MRRVIIIRAPTVVIAGALTGIIKVLIAITINRRVVVAVMKSILIIIIQVANIIIITTNIISIIGKIQIKAVMVKKSIAKDIITSIVTNR